MISLQLLLSRGFEKHSTKVMVKFAKISTSQKVFSRNSRVDNLLENIDIAASSPTAKISPRRKLKSSLEKPTVKSLPVSAQGQLDSFGEELADILNDALASKDLANTFRGTSVSADVIEINEVNVNQDASHVTAYWSSRLLNEFVAMIKKEEEVNPQEKRNNKSDALVIWDRGVRIINQKLRLREPQFRSYLIKKVDFRRVPRIFFAAYDSKTIPVNTVGHNAVGNHAVDLSNSELASQHDVVTEDLITTP